MLQRSLPRSLSEIYGARILRRSIEDDRRNFTRFFLLRTAEFTRRFPLKVSERIPVEDIAGVLYTERARSLVPMFERFRTARSQSHQDRIPAVARKTLGVPFLPGLPRQGGYS